MLRSPSIILLLALWATGAVSASAQARMQIYLDTNAPEAVVFADSLRLGRAADGPYILSSAVRAIRLVPLAEDNWDLAPLVHIVTPSDTGEVTLSMHFPYYYRIESLPFGASVYVDAPGGRLRLGTTPLTYQSAAPLVGTIRIEKTGYLPQAVEPGPRVWNRHVVALGAPPGEPWGMTSEVTWNPPPKQRKWIDYTALGVAAAAGLLSVHYKFKADRRYDRYLETGDFDLRSEIKSYDRRAWVALAGMQVGIGVFAVRLALR